jgi:hypothetical protein
VEPTTSPGRHASHGRSLDAREGTASWRFVVGGRSFRAADPVELFGAPLVLCWLAASVVLAVALILEGLGLRVLGEALGPGFILAALFVTLGGILWFVVAVVVHRRAPVVWRRYGRVATSALLGATIALGYYVAAVRSSPPPASAAHGAVSPLNQTTCPPDHPIKGNQQSMIYHTRASRSYAATRPEACFAAAVDAQAAGYRAARD